MTCRIIQSSFQTIKMLLDMQDHPEQFSDEALKQMLNDAEAQELMEATAQLKRAIINDEFTVSEQDVEDEWKEFASKHFAKQKPQYNWLKMAAMFIGILFVTGLAFASIHMIRHNSGIQEFQPKEQLVRQQAVLANTNQGDTAVQAEPVVFGTIWMWTCKTSRPASYAFISYGSRVIVCRKWLRN